MREALISFAFIACYALGYVAAQTEPTPSDQTTYAPGKVNVRDVCICVVKGYCNLANANSSDDGAGGLDPRIMTTGEDTPPITGANNDTMIPTSTGNIVAVTNQTTCATGLELCCPPGGYTCGVVYPPVENAPEAITTQGQVLYGAFPWQAALLSQRNEFICSGVLIDQMTVLTAAHKITSVTVPFKVRLGSWDATGKQNVFKAYETNYSSIIYHPQYNPKNLKFDIAIIRLSTPAPLGTVPTLTNICLPSSPIQSGMRCWVSGWGKGDASNTSTYSPIMKATDVPLVDADKCQMQLRATRLGQNFVLDSSTFICAGGEFAKDACTGDGGAPLSCSIGGYWYLAGLVAWGIGCGQANVPGVYVNIFNLTNWIQQTNNATMTNNMNTTTSPGTPTTPSPTTKSSNTTASSATTIKSNSTSVTSSAPVNSTATTKAGNATTVSSNSTTSTTKLSNSTSATTTKLSNVTTTLGPNTTMTTPKSGGRIVTTTNVRIVAPTSSTVKASNLTSTIKSNVKAADSTTKTTVKTSMSTGKKVGGDSVPTPKFSSTQAFKSNTTTTTTKTIPKSTAGTTKKVESAVQARSGVTVSSTTLGVGPADSLGPSDIL